MIRRGIGEDGSEHPAEMSLDVPPQSRVVVHVDVSDLLEFQLRRAPCLRVSNSRSWRLSSRGTLKTAYLEIVPISRRAMFGSRDMLDDVDHQGDIAFLVGQRRAADSQEGLLLDPGWYVHLLLEHGENRSIAYLVTSFRERVAGGRRPRRGSSPRLLRHRGPSPQTPCAPRSCPGAARIFPSFWGSPALCIAGFFLTYSSRRVESACDRPSYASARNRSPPLASEKSTPDDERSAPCSHRPAPQRGRAWHPTRSEAARGHSPPARRRWGRSCGTRSAR